MHFFGFLSIDMKVAMFGNFYAMLICCCLGMAYAASYMESCSLVCWASLQVETWLGVFMLWALLIRYVVWNIRDHLELNWEIGIDVWIVVIVNGIELWKVVLNGLSNCECGRIWIWKIVLNLYGKCIKLQVEMCIVWIVLDMAC